MTDTALPWLLPDWDSPPGVFACVTTRRGGHSSKPYDSFNLGTHVADAPDAVQANRALLLAALQACSAPAHVNVQWLQQVHGTHVHRVDVPVPQPPPEADALYTRLSGIACAVLTADCLPVLLAAGDGSEIAVAHAGWRGLVNGILERTVAQFSVPPASIRAWLGPAIAACHFEVGAEVRQRFLEAAPAALQAATAGAFRGVEGGKYFADLYLLARLRLQALGLDQITGQPRCTVCDTGRWYSYRREGLTGRFATLILRTR